MTEQGSSFKIYPLSVNNHHFWVGVSVNILNITYAIYIHIPQRKTVKFRNAVVVRDIEIGVHLLKFKLKVIEEKRDYVFVLKD